MDLKTCTIGFPRIGPNREMKKALESYWSKSIGERELLEAYQGVLEHAWKAQKDAGMDLIGVDGTLYDQMLDMCMLLGLVPDRFKSQNMKGLDLYFAMARGFEVGKPEGAACGAGCAHSDGHALDMSKFLNTNYHYLVPEACSTTEASLNTEMLFSKIKMAQATVGVDKAVPMLMGPITLARLANLSGIDVPTFVQKLVPVYADLLGQLSAMKVPEVQMLEPVLGLYDAGELQSLYEATYATLSKSAAINLVTFYDDVGECFSWVTKLPVKAISLDFCGVIGAATPCRSLEFLKKYGFPADKTLGAGVIDGRNIWADTGNAAALISEIQKATKAPIRIQSSCSLQHVPIDKMRETKLPETLMPKLAFAQQKLFEMKAVASGEAPVAGAVKVESRPPNIDKKLFDRPAPYGARRELQFQAHPTIPAYPTTTIGSFPQTKEIRKVRADFKAGRISEEEHDKQMDQFMKEVIDIQEEIGLDVFVHGEPERSDMVEYFGQYLEGFAFTQYAWVQSYGSRYVRPPIIYGDVTRPGPMTIREFKVAQSFSKKPVKGMLTGPVTVLNWSFPRNDVSRSTTCYQLALALREEVADLEKAGCSIIQVDDPALREGLPLKTEQWPSYLEWAADSFRLTCGVAKPETQIVTHLCYSEFADILPAIDRLDADVLTIENARSDDAMIHSLNKAGYSRDIGAGVYDVHSPVVPSVDFMASRVKSFLNTGILDKDARRIWVNPDCGLKTRNWKEVIPSLKNMVEAAKAMRVGAQVH